MDDQTATAGAAHRQRRRMPWKFLAIVLFLVGGIGWAQWYRQFEPGTANLSTYIASGILILATAIFIARRGILPGALRFAPLALILVGVAAFLTFYRFDGWVGELHPSFVRRFTSREPLPELPSQTANGGDLTAVAPVATTAHDFPGFLGPNHDQTITAVRLARDWDKQPPRLIWRHAVGQGWSGFAVVADYAVTQEQRGDQEMVVCYDLKSGESRWAHGDTARFGSEGSFGGVGPRATPAIHNGRVFTLGATGILNCLELATGRMLWTRNIHRDTETDNVYWGTSGSPLIVDDLVVLSAGGKDGNSLLAYRQVDGERAWSGGSDPASYASPSLATLCGIRQILIVNQDWVTGHDAANGRVLWRFEWEGKSDREGNSSQARVVGGNRVFVSKGYTKGAGLFEFDPDKLKAAREKGTTIEPKLVWDKSTNRKAVLKTKLSNVCFRGDYVYGLDESMLQCVELATGKEQWKRGRYGHGQLLLIDDLLLVQAEDGRVLLVEANPEQHVELGSFQAIEGEPCWNCPALAGRYFIVRNKDEAACYELPVAE